MVIVEKEEEEIQENFVNDNEELIIKETDIEISAEGEIFNKYAENDSEN